MAFIDKCTHMRRCAIIRGSNGSIVYEGVLIEGVFVLKEVTNGGLYSIKQEDIWDYFNLDNCFGDYNLLVFMDKDINGKWVPREEKGQIEFDGYFYDYTENFEEEF